MKFESHNISSWKRLARNGKTAATVVSMVRLYPLSRYRPTNMCSFGGGMLDRNKWSAKKSVNYLSSFASEPLHHSWWQAATSTEVWASSGLNRRVGLGDLVRQSQHDLTHVLMSLKHLLGWIYWMCSSSNISPKQILFTVSSYHQLFPFLFIFVTIILINPQRLPMPTWSWPDRATFLTPPPWWILSFIWCRLYHGHTCRSLSSTT